MGKKLNIGCGEDYREGWINLDIRDNIKTDIKHDLEKYPYPFKSNTFDEVEIRMVIEHIKEPIKFLKEICRICKNKAKIHISTPHANSYAQYSDLQHRNFFTENTFDNWHLIEYELNQLKLLNTWFSWDYKYKKFIPFKKLLKIYFNGIYDYIHFEFEVRK